MSEIAAWLENLGLGKYQTVFAEDESDFDLLGKLSESDLEQFDIPIGPRERLLNPQDRRELIFAEQIRIQ